MQLSYSMPPVMKDGAPAVDENGFYSVAYTDSYFITESLSGDKELYIERLVCPQGYVNKFTNSNAATAQAVEFDITLHRFERYGIVTSATIQISDANGKNINIRINLNCEKATDMITVQDQPADTTKRHTYADGTETYSIGATYTVLTAFNTEKGTVDVTVNGVAYGSLPITNWGSYSSEFVYDENVTIKSASINCESGSGNDLSIDNVTFLAN